MIAITGPGSTSSPNAAFSAPGNMVCKRLREILFPCGQADQGPTERKLVQFLSTIFKIAVASLIVGATLSALNISAADLLAQVGLTPEEIWTYLQIAVDWAIPNIILGSLIVVPIWIVIYLFRPPSA
jgi:hypothetical protein